MAGVTPFQDVAALSYNVCDGWGGLWVGIAVCILERQKRVAVAVGLDPILFVCFDIFVIERKFAGQAARKVRFLFLLRGCSIPCRSDTS